jgi:hypothetical protein
MARPNTAYGTPQRDSCHDLMMRPVGLPSGVSSKPSRPCKAKDTQVVTPPASKTFRAPTTKSSCLSVSRRSPRADGTAFEAKSSLSRTGGFRATSVTSSKSLLDRIVLPKPLHRFGKCLSGDAAITMAGILCKIKMVMIALALEH